MSKKFVQGPTYYLAGSGVIVGATSVTLTNFNDIYGNALALADFGDKGYATLEPDTSNEEAFTFTSVTTNANGTVTLGGVSTSLAKSPYTETSGLARQHVGGTKVVITDNVAFWNTFANKANDETITGKYTFPLASRPTLSSDADTATATDFVTLGQLSRQAISGASNASTTIKGIVELATQAEVDARTTTGGTGALLVPTPDTIRSTLLSDYKADTGAADAAVITPVPAITAYAVGQQFSFKVVATNTTTTPTLNVNGLGAKTIVKVGGGALAAGDLIINRIYQVEYDGTNMQLLAPVPSEGLPAQASKTGFFLTTNGTTQSWARVNPLVYINTAQVSINTTTAETTLYTTSIPANILSTGNALKIEIPISVINAATVGKTHTIRVKYGATTLTTTVATINTNGITFGTLTIYLMATGATNSQRAVTQLFAMNGSGSTATNNDTISAISVGTAAIDSTASQTFTVSVQPNESNTNTRFTAEACIVTLII